MSGTSFCLGGIAPVFWGEVRIIRFRVATSVTFHDSPWLMSVDEIRPARGHIATKARWERLPNDQQHLAVEAEICGRLMLLGG